MKNIKINYLTIYLLLIYFLCGYIKLGIIIFSIVLIHELGHIIMIKIFRYKILSVTIYPFGGITKVDKDINTSPNKEILIAISGIFFQLLLFIILNLLPLSLNTIKLTFKYNLTILLFNLMPIIPLDGSIILKSILNKFISFKLSYFIEVFISIIFIIIYISINMYYSLNNYLLVFLFIYKIKEAINNYDYIYNRFLLERYLKKYKFKYISTKKGNLDILKLDTYQYFKENEKIVPEYEKLAEKFDKKRLI